MATLPLLLFGMAAVGSIGFAVTKKERSTTTNLTIRVIDGDTDANELYFAMSQLQTDLSTFQLFYKKASEQVAFSVVVIDDHPSEIREQDGIFRTYLFPYIVFDPTTEYAFYVEKTENNDVSTIVRTPTVFYTTGVGETTNPGGGDV